MRGLVLVGVMWGCLGLCTGSLLRYVDPLVGSGGADFGAASLPPGAQLPFSNARVSPDTVPESDVWLPFDHYGGYHYGGYPRRAPSRRASRRAATSRRGRRDCS